MTSTYSENVLCQYRAGIIRC